MSKDDVLEQQDFILDEASRRRVEEIVGNATPQQKQVWDFLLSAKPGTERLMWGYVYASLLRDPENKFWAACAEFVEVMSHGKH